MKGALSNLKILDFSTLLPGPYATMMLADMGAEVLKISSKSKHDLVLSYGEKDKDTNLGSMGLWINRNKNTISLNLKTKEAINIVKKLILEYDILIEQFRPGVMEKLGLSYEELKKINPRLIYCSITGYGQTGQDKDRAGHDLNFLARSGILSLSGTKENGPSLINAQLGDTQGALNAIIAILAAINYRNITNEGQYIDISMLDCLIPLNTFEGADYLITNKLKNRQENDFNGKGIYDIYKTKDNRYLSIASLEEKFFETLIETLNIKNFVKENKLNQNSKELKEKIKQIIIEKPLIHWQKLFSDKDACVEIISNLEDIFKNDKHLKDRNMIVDVKHNDGYVKQIASPIKFSKTKMIYKHAAKEIGKDTIDVLKNLGYTEKEIENLKNKDVFK